MAEKTPEQKKTAVGRSMLDLDILQLEALEQSALGRHEESVIMFKRVLDGLEDRFKSVKTNIPVDVLVRRFKTLIYLARAYSACGAIDKASQKARAAAELARAPLADFPEFFLLACSEICSHFVTSGDLNSAKTIVAQATKAQKGDDIKYAQAIIGCTTGKLLIGFNKHEMAVHALKKGVAALEEPEGRDQVNLKAELLFTCGLATAGVKKDAESAEYFLQAVEYLFNTAHDLFVDGHVIEAICCLSQASEISEHLAESSDNSLIKADIMILLAQLLEIRGYWRDSYKMSAAVMANLEDNDIKDPGRIVLCMNGIARIDSNWKRYTEAGEVLRKAIAVAEDGDVKYGLALTLYNFGLVQSKSANDEQGMEYFEKALDVVDQLVGDREKARLSALIHNQMGFISAKFKKYEDAVEHMKTSLELLRPYPHDLALGETNRMLGEIYAYRQKVAQGEKALRRGLEIFERNNASVEIAAIYKSIGENFLNVGDLNKATFFVDEGIKILENLGLEADLPKLYSAKANIYVLRDKYERAEEFYKKDFDIAKKTENKHSLAFSYFHLGFIRRKLGRVHSAEDFLKRSINLFEEVNNEKGLGLVLLELAQCVLGRKDYRLAMDYCMRAQKMFEQKGFAYSLELARLFMVRGVVHREAVFGEKSRARNHEQVALRCFEDSLRNFEREEIENLELAETYYEFALYWRNVRKERAKATECLIKAIDLVEKLGYGQKISRFLNKLNEINPEEGAKMRLARVMDKSAVDQITKKSGDDSLVVEPKNLTLFFTDIRGFTTISESLPLDELTAFLNDFYRNVTKVIMSCQGRINKFIGDEVLAIFNMDGATEDHPLWAVKAGLELVRAMDETNHIREKQGQAKIGIGIGINTGQVLLGTFGSGLRQDYTAIGDNVNIAARLQAQAAAGEIIISQNTYELVKDHVIAEDLGEKPLKGKGQHINLWKVTGLKD